MTVFATDLLNTLRVGLTAVPTTPLVFETSLEELVEQERLVDERTIRSVKSFPFTGQLSGTSKIAVTPSERYNPDPQHRLGWRVRSLRIFNPNAETATVDIGRFQVPGDESSTFLVLWHRDLPENATLTLDSEGVLSVASPFDGIPLDYWMQVQRALVPGHRGWFKYGLAELGATIGVDSDIWDLSQTFPVYPYLTAASLIDVASSSVNDAPAGSGVDEVTIFGVDGGWNFITEDVPLNGITPVTTVQTFLRIFRVQTIGPGPTTAPPMNAGNIDFTAQSSGNILARIGVQNGRSFMSHMVVPEGKRALVVEASIQMAGKTNGVIIAYAQTSVAQTPWLKTNIQAISGTAGQGKSTFKLPIPYGGLPARTDIKIVANPDSNNLIVATSFQIVWIDEDAPI